MIKKNKRIKQTPSRHVSPQQEREGRHVTVAVRGTSEHPEGHVSVCLATHTAQPKNGLFTATETLSPDKKMSISVSTLPTASLSGGNTASIASAAAALGIATGVNDTVSIGQNCATLQTGFSNVFIGNNAAANSVNGDLNAIVGFHAAPRLAGTANALFGGRAARDLETGRYNVVVGPDAGDGLRTGSRNVVIGANAKPASGDAAKAVVIGADASAAGSGTSIGPGAVAAGKTSVSIGSGTVAPADGSFNIANRIQGFFVRTASAAAYKATYMVHVAGDVLSIAAGSALAFAGSNIASPAWMMRAEGTDLVLRSAAGTVVRFVDDFHSGVLNFTGQHRCELLGAATTASGAHSQQHSPHHLAGRLVVSAGTYSAFPRRPRGVDDAVPRVRLSSRACDPSVFGVVSGSTAVGRHRLGFMAFETGLEEGAERVLVNSAGEGAVWVCDEGGPIRNGDLLVSASVIQGVCMRQPDHMPYVCASTAAKATCDCDFGPESGLGCMKFFPSHAGVRVRLIGCLYKF